MPPGAGNSQATGPAGIDFEFPVVGSTMTTALPADAATIPIGGLSLASAIGIQNISAIATEQNLECDLTMHPL
jgi:hypothetical protein